MRDYYRLQNYLSFKGIEFNKWLIRHRHLTLAQRQAAWDNLCAELQPIAHDMRVFEESAAYQKTALENIEWRGI